MDALMWLLLPLLAGIGSSLWAWWPGPARSTSLRASCECNALPEGARPAPAAQRG